LAVVFVAVVRVSKDWIEQRTTDYQRLTPNVLPILVGAPFVFDFALGGMRAFFGLGACERVTGRREGLANRVVERARRTLLRRLSGV